MEISQTQTPLQSPASVPTNDSGAISSDFETFLRMLTVQMENQDPLNPVDSSDYAVQLATFSGVEQQVQTNDLLRNLATQLGTSGMAQMAVLVGKEARAPTQGYFDGDGILLAPNPVSVADRAEIVVTNAEGTEVDRFDIAVSADPVTWSGLDPDGYPHPIGLYSFQAISYAGDEALAQDTVDVYSTVTEVRAQDGESILILEGGAAISAQQVSALRAPTS